MKPKRKFTQQQKLQIIQLVLNDNLTVRQVTDLHQIERQTVHRWINEYKEFGEKAFLENSFITKEQELNKLKRQVKKLKEENALLSVRVSAIFAATLLAGGKQECTWHHEANQQQDCEKFLFYFSSQKNIYLFNICPFLKGKCHAILC